MTLSNALRKLPCRSIIGSFGSGRLHPHGPTTSYLATTQARPASNNIDKHIQDKKQAQESRHHIDRQSDEHILSGTDDALAMEPKVSYDRGPPANVEDAQELAQRVFGTKSNPLDVSAANPVVSETHEGEYKLGQKESPETSSYHGATPAKLTTAQTQAQPKKEIFAGVDKRNPGVTEARPSKHKNRPIQP